jgi:hypothetical protein
VVKKGKAVLLGIAAAFLVSSLLIVGCATAENQRYEVAYRVTGNCTCFVYYIDEYCQPVFATDPVLPWNNTYYTGDGAQVLLLCAYNLDATGSDMLTIEIMINDVPVLSGTDDGSGDSMVSVTIGPSRISEVYTE